jgi:hypothetical protein
MFMPSRSMIAQRTVSTTLANSTSNPSPVVLTIRPWARRFSDRLPRAERLELGERAYFVHPPAPATSAARTARPGGLRSFVGQAGAAQSEQQRFLGERAVLGIAEAAVGTVHKEVRQRVPGRPDPDRLCQPSARLVNVTLQSERRGEPQVRISRPGIGDKCFSEQVDSLVDVAENEMASGSARKKRCGSRRSSRRSVSLLRGLRMTSTIS